MDIELPDTITSETLRLARPAVAALRGLLSDGALPDGLTEVSVVALLSVMDGVAEAISGDPADLSPTEAADRLRVARPTLMRLIARGELSARKDGGHYVLSPRDLRTFQARLGPARQEAMGEMAAMVDEFGF
jgi:excisionase family DNA binding protein